MTITKTATPQKNTRNHTNIQHNTQTKQQLTQLRKTKTMKQQHRKKTTKQTRTKNNYKTNKL